MKIIDWNIIQGRLGCRHISFITKGKTYIGCKHPDNWTDEMVENGDILQMCSYEICPIKGMLYKTKGEKHV